jgi:NAD(P)-dependent dehydrogenase (short-subunit alcohol dehydrogenase family)
VLPSRRPRSVFISGAGRGIGRATAGLFLARGWRVGMYDVDADVVAGAAAGRDGAVHGAAEGHRYLKRSTRGLLLNLCSASAL